MWAAGKQQGDADQLWSQYRGATQIASPLNLFCSGSFGFKTLFALLGDGKCSPDLAL